MEIFSKAFQGVLLHAETLCKKISQLVLLFMFERCITAAVEFWKMRKPSKDDRTLKYCDYARCTTYSTVQVSNRPLQNNFEGKNVFSGKHKLIGLKV